MAKGKKKDTLTPEERLQAALVPDWEQPYKVPENWCWVRLGTICSLENGNRHKDEELVYFDVKTLRSADSTQKRNNGIVVNKNQKVILVDGENSGEVFIIPYRGYMGSTFRIINISNYAEEIYIRYFISYNQDKLKKNKVGSAIPHLNKELFFGLELPFPPLKEQQCIVDRIESLFARLDEAKQKAQDALDSFETRKAAILHRAFIGELTARWREEHGVGMESWKEETLESVCYSIFDGDHMPPPKSEQGIPFLVISNVNTGHLSFKNTRFVPESYYKALSNTRKPEYGDVLYTLVGSYGIPVVVNSEMPFCFQRHMALLKPKNVNSYYLWYILQSKEMFERVTQIATGTAQLTVPIKGLRKLQFNCASFNEQTEIVRILDNLLAKEQQAREAAEAVIEQIGLIKKSILARAFRGELGTNDPAEESSVELVRQILEKGDETAGKPKVRMKRIVIPAEMESVLSNANEEEIIRVLMKAAPEAVSIQTIMSISRKKFELMDALRSLEKKQLVMKTDTGEYLLMR